jgi:hypothetical protein
MINVTDRVLIFTLLSATCWAQCASKCSGGLWTPNTTIACACNVEWDSIAKANGAQYDGSSNYAAIPQGNETSLYYDVYWLAADGANNTDRMFLDIHGGAWNGARGDTGPDSDIINKHIVQYEPTYVLDGMVENTGQINPGVSGGTFTYTPQGYGAHFCGVGDVGGWTITDGLETLNVLSCSGSITGPITIQFTGSTTQTHPAGNMWVIPNVNWPTPARNMASLMSFLGQCSAGGTSPGTGDCTPFANMAPGDPNKMIIVGGSSGGAIAHWLSMADCNEGATCPFLDNTPGDPGYTKWAGKNWTWGNPYGTTMLLLCAEADAAPGYMQDSLVFPPGPYPPSASSTSGLLTPIGYMLCSQQASCNGTAPSCDNYAPGSMNLGPWMSQIIDYPTPTVTTFNPAGLGVWGGTNYTSLTGVGNKGQEPDISPAFWSADGAAGESGCSCTSGPSQCYQDCDKPWAQGGGGMGTLSALRAGASIPVSTWECGGGADYHFMPFDTQLSAFNNVSYCFDPTIGHCGCVTSTVCGPQFVAQFGDAPNYSILASPASLSVQQGNQGTSTITTTISGGFNSAISLSASGVPSGTTGSFNPSPIPAPGSGSSTMTMTVGASTPTGAYPITVTGSGGGIQQSTTVTLTVTAAPNFTISASPSSLSIQQGNQGTSTITTTISGGLNSAISLSASGVPSSTTVSFNPNPIPAPGSGSSTITVTVGSTPVGTYPITLTGSGGGIQQNATLMLTVTSASGGWRKGFDFRNTSTFVIDPAGDTYVLATSAYPTNRNGVTFGWTQTFLVTGRDRKATIDPRLAGINVVNNGSQRTFFVDLPSTGTYNLSLALGDAGYKQCLVQCQVQFFDGTTLLATVNGEAIAAGYFYDMQKNKWSAAAWPANNVSQQVTLTGTRLSVVVGTSKATGDFTTIAFLGVAQATD